jgi:hypothetical protein
MDPTEDPPHDQRTFYQYLMISILDPPHEHFERVIEEQQGYAIKILAGSEPHVSS